MNDINQTLVFAAAETKTTSAYELEPGVGALSVVVDTSAISGSGASLALKAQFSDDATTWVDDDAYPAITATGKSRFVTPTRYRYVRFSGTLTGTTPTATARVHAEPTANSDVVDQPSVINKTLTNADEEYSQALPVGTRKFLLKARSLGSELKFSFTNGESATNYVTVPPGSGGLWVECGAAYGVTLYVQSPTAGEVAEILAIK